MDSEALKWLFSSIAQTYGALVGILGMLVVYKLQLIANMIREIRQKYMGAIYHFFGLESYVITDRQLVKSWKSIAKDQEVTPEKNTMDDFAKTIEPLLHKSNEIRSEFTRFLVPHLALILTSIILLLITDQIATLDFGIVIGLLIVLLAISFIMILSLCITLITE